MQKTVAYFAAPASALTAQAKVSMRTGRTYEHTHDEAHTHTRTHRAAQAAQTEAMRVLHLSNCCCIWSANKWFMMMPPHSLPRPPAPCSLLHSLAMPFPVPAATAVCHMGRSLQQFVACCCCCCRFILHFYEKA